MSLVQISGNVSGTGTLTIAAPNTNSNYTLTLPTNTGTLLSTKSAGTVLQVVQGTTNTQSSTTSTTLVTTGLSTSITPSSSTSKILVLINMGDVGSLNSGGGTNGAAFGIYRGASAVVSNLSSQISYSAINPSNLTVCGFSSTYLDSPATTSSTTYTVYFKSQGAATTVYSFRDNTQGSITLMEIAA
jgi:hypothetical protein